MLTKGTKKTGDLVNLQIYSKSLKLELGKVQKEKYIAVKYMMIVVILIVLMMILYCSYIKFSLPWEVML